MIGGSGEYVPFQQTLYTGLSVIKPLIANPSDEEYEHFTGRKPNYPLTYDKFGEEGELQPISILCEIGKGSFEFIRFVLSSQDDTTKDGTKSKFIDGKGRISYYLDDPYNISDRFPFDPKTAVTIKRGYEDLTNFLQKLVAYDSKSPQANWMSDASKNGLDVETLYSGNVNGLNALLDWAFREGFSVVTLLSVSKTEKDGNTYYNQRIESRSDLFFYSVTNHGEAMVPATAFSRLRKYEKQQEEAGYSITKHLYTHRLQEFREEDCAHSEPEGTVNNATVTNWQV